MKVALQIGIKARKVVVSHRLGGSFGWAHDRRGFERQIQAGGRAPLPSKTAHSLCAVSSPASVGHLFVATQNPVTRPGISPSVFFW